MVPYVVSAVTAMHALLCVCCEGDGNAGVGSGGVVVAMSGYMGGTRGLGVLSSAGDVVEMSVVRGVGGVCNMCMCLALGGVGGVGGELVRGLGFTNPVGTEGKWDMCVFWLRWWWGGALVGVFFVFVVSLDSLCSWQVQVSVYCRRV